MHPSRWGDPAAATALPEATRGLVELALGVRDTPAASAVTLPAPSIDAAILDDFRRLLGDEHVLTEDDVRRLRTRGKSTPDLLKQRLGDLSDAPDAVVRPGSHGDVQAVIELAVRHHVALRSEGRRVGKEGGSTARHRGSPSH